MTYGEFFLYSVLVFACLGQEAARAPAVDNREGSCVATISQNPPFMPPSPYSQGAPRGMFWYGNDELWTLLGTEGTWSEHPPEGCNGYCTKLTYWARSFDSKSELNPKLTVTARRIDREAPIVVGSEAHAVFIGHAAMMTGLDIPTAGCWEITAKYRNQKLSFIRSVRIER
jgi:hypothetical protein